MSAADLIAHVGGMLSGTIKLGAVDGVFITHHPDASVVNLAARERALTPADVTNARQGLTEAGYREVESWIATTGASWLSDGVGSVSIRYARIDA